MKQFVVFEKDLKNTLLNQQTHCWKHSIKQKMTKTLFCFEKKEQEEQVSRREMKQQEMILLNQTSFKSQRKTLFQQGLCF